MHVFVTLHASSIGLLIYWFICLFVHSLIQALLCFNVTIPSLYSIVAVFVLWLLLKLCVNSVPGHFCSRGVIGRTAGCAARGHTAAQVIFEQLKKLGKKKHDASNIGLMARVKRDFFNSTGSPGKKKKKKHITLSLTH